MYKTIVITLLLLPVIGNAADSGGFVPLVGIPYVQNQVSSLGGYANALYFAAISIGAILAMIKIIIAGMKYMLSDIVTDKSKAKKDIQGALFGLILMIAAVLILTTINPNITNIKALEGISALDTSYTVAPGTLMYTTDASKASLVQASCTEDLGQFVQTTTPGTNLKAKANNTSKTTSVTTSVCCKNDGSTQYPSKENNVCNDYNASLAETGIFTKTGLTDAERDIAIADCLKTEGATYEVQVSGITPRYQRYTVICK